MSASEKWLPVVGFEGSYEVSDMGRVRSLDRFVTYIHPRSGRPSRRFFTGVVLNPPIGGNGRPHVILRRRTRQVHRLVAEAFLGPVPEGMEVCHNNGDMLDNRAVNLRYGTHSENLRDRVKHGTDPEARKTHCPQGHEYSPENTGRNSSGRRCLTCHRERQTRRYWAKKAAMTAS